MPLKVTAALLMQDNKVLIAQKGPNDKRANLWEFPGGKIDPGETPEESLAREMMEEFLIQVKVDGLFAESLFTYPEGKILVMAYFCTLTVGTPTLTEHADYKWVRPSELGNYDFVPSDIPIAQKLAVTYRHSAQHH